MALPSSSSRESSIGRVSSKASRASVQASGVALASQPHSSRVSSAAGSRLRRRLSKIFQRDKALSGLSARPWVPVCSQGTSHGSSCQSPRIQRCRRLLSAL
ncbi:hypothetical protein D3C76_674440 [compost metagenome]